MIRSRCFVFAMLCSRFASIAASFLSYAQKVHPLAVEMALGAGDAAICGVACLSYDVAW